MQHQSDSVLKHHPQIRTFSEFGYNPFFDTLSDTKKPIPKTNLNFHILDSQKDINRAFEIRHDVFCKEMMVIDPNNHPDGKETDDYDDNSLHTAITEDGEIIAYVRLVLPCNKFPIERTNILPKNFDRSKSVETSRGLVVKHKRHCDVTWHMFNSIYLLCQKNNLDSILSFSNAIMFNGYRKRHVPFSYVGDPVFFHGHKSYPLIIKVDKNIQANFIQ